MILRCLGLILLGFVIYHLDGEVKSWEALRNLGLRGFLAGAFKRELFQTLVHIALASLWVLPVIAAGTMTRVAYPGRLGGPPSRAVAPVLLPARLERCRSSTAARSAS